MNLPNFSEEKKLWKNRFKIVVGLDEAGRGPLAGPVVAAAAVFCHCEERSDEAIQSEGTNSRLSRRLLAPHNDSFGILKKINDSKKLSEKQREEICNVITKHPQIKWGVGIVSEKVIDKINILEATKLAMERAISSLRGASRRRGNDGYLDVDFLLIDGNFSLDLNTPQKSIIKGDQKVMSIAAASIIAKVTRDRLMKKMHKKYPQYGFEKHKGYGTAVHIKNLKKFGPCKIHRKSFYPVSVL